MQLLPIDCIDNYDVEDFICGHLTPQRPVILKGFASNWTATRRWTPNYMSDSFGDLRLTCRVSREGIFPNLVSPTQVKKQKTTLSALIDEIPTLAATEETYLGGGDIVVDGGTPPAGSPEHRLIIDTRLPSFVPADSVTVIGFWISSNRVSSWLHYDENGAHNINAQIIGRKRAVLISPDQTSACSMCHDSKIAAPNFSMIDPRTLKADYRECTDKLKCFEGILGGGDAIYIPPMWLHSFDHLDPLNVNVNFWWLHNRNWSTTSCGQLLSAGSQ